MLGRQFLFSFVLVVISFVFTAGVVLAEDRRLAEVSSGEMILIPAGKFTMGIDQDDPKGLVWASPKREVFLPEFYIDKLEVTNRDYKKFVDAVDHRVPFDDRYDTIYDWEDGLYRKNFEDHPVALVDWFDATLYCKWAGKRLPTEAEWEKAARGTDGRVWPWGNDLDKFKSNTIYFNVRMSMPVGTFQGDVSPYGVMDMTGNLSEWTSDWYKGYPGIKLENVSFGELYKVTRGSTWAAPAKPHGYTMARSSQQATHKHRSIGFRCARSVK